MTFRGLRCTPILGVLPVAADSPAKDGPNPVCSDCGVEVGAKESDCWTDNLVALIVSAVTESVASRPNRQ